MSDIVSIVTVILGGFILLYGLFSLIIREKLYLSEASVALIIGIIFGPVCANFIDINEWGDEVAITHEFSRIVIAIQVMATGVALPKAYLKTEFKSICIILGPIMLFTWLVSGLLVWAFLPGLNFLEALMIAACFTPTDPVLASSIVHGKFAEEHVPAHVRDIIACESGANDGLGYPFLFLAIYLLQMDVGPAIGKWFYWIMAFQVLLSVVIGFVVGYVARKLLQYVENRNWIDKESFVVFSVALALFLMGAVGLIGSDDLLACFIAGNSFTWNDWFRIKTERENLMEIVDLLLNLSIFAYIGLTMPWSSFSDPALQTAVWRLVVLGILVLLLRRLPMVMSLYRFVPALHDWREAVFFGWFGPIGVGAIFYYTVAVEAIPEDGPNAHARSLIKPVIYFMVLASVVAHGITVPLGTLVKRSLTHASHQIMLDKIVGRGRSPPTPDQHAISTETLESVQDEDTTSKDHATVTIHKSPQAPENVYRQRASIHRESTLSLHNDACQLPTISSEGMAHRRISHSS